MDNVRIDDIHYRGCWNSRGLYCWIIYIHEVQRMMWVKFGLFLGGMTMFFGVLFYVINQYLKDEDKK